MHRLIRVWRNLRGRDRVERDLADEVRAAVDQLADEKVRAGVDPIEARRLAALELGGVESVKAQVRDVRAGAFVDTLVQDVRYAARLLRRNPLFTLTAALSLAIGIGATTTIFTIANGLLLRYPAGVREPDRVIDIFHTEAVGPLVAAANPQSSYAMYEDLRARATTVEDVFAYELGASPWSLVSGDEGAERVFGISVSPNYFSALGARAAAGRVFRTSDGDRPGEAALAVLSHAFWTRRFNTDPSIVGRTIRLNGRPFTVVGVAADGFRGTSVVAPEIWVPAPAKDNLRFVQVMIGGRLKPEVSIAQARAEIEVLGRVLNEQHGKGKDVGGVILPGAAGDGLSVAALSLIPGNIRLVVAAFLSLLMTLVSIVLVIACANLAGVLIARASARRREIAVRLAVGVGRARLVRQLLTETMLLFVLGCAAGLFLARGMTTLVMALLPSFEQPVAVSMTLDWRVVAFSIALSSVAAVLSGLAPALHASKADVITSLKDESHGPPERLRLRSAFVVAQVAFSLVLVIAAGLFVQRLRSVTAPGDDGRADVDVVSIDLGLAGLNEDEGRQFVRDLSDRIRGIPSIQRAAIADQVPDPGRLFGMAGSLTVPGTDQPTARGMAVAWTVVAPGYFQALDTPIVAGREFTVDDRSGSQPVVVVTESTARRLWPGADPLGRTLVWQWMGPAGAGPATTMVVVGVVRGPDSGRPDTGPPRATLYVPFEQRYSRLVTILASRAGTAPAASDIAALIRSMNRNLPVLSARTLEEELTGPEDVQLRIAASVSGTVGLVGVLLAAIGIYGVTAYAVARRTREIGVRLAIGAGRGAVTTMVLRQGMSLVAIGCAIGLVLAAVVSRVMASTVFGIPPLEIDTFAGAVVCFALIGLAACYVPVRRAGRITAMEALRYE